MENNSYCVYCHTNKVNGKKYIGQTYHQLNPENRWGQNGEGYIYNNHFWRAIQKYGWENFDHIIIQTNLTKDEADNLENYYIEFYCTMDPQKGYNKRGGGSHGAYPDEIKQKCREATIKKWQDDEYRQKELENNSMFTKGRTPWNKDKHGIYSEETIERFKSSWSYEKHFTDKTKQKLSISHKKYADSHRDEVLQRTKPMHEARKRKVDQFDLDGNYIQTFNSIKEATLLGFSSSKISDVAAGKRPHHKGYIWKYHSKGGGIDG